MPGGSGGCLLTVFAFKSLNCKTLPIICSEKKCIILVIVSNIHTKIKQNAADVLFVLMFVSYNVKAIHRLDGR